MLSITKKERDYLVSKGVPTGENGISRTHSKYKKYFLCEATFNVKLLNEYRKQIGVN